MSDKSVLTGSKNIHIYRWECSSSLSRKTKEFINKMYTTKKGCGVGHVPPENVGLRIESLKKLKTGEVVIYWTVSPKWDTANGEIKA